jgi:MmyB-like transcription regulator ligand binding domain
MRSGPQAGLPAEQNRTISAPATHRDPDVRTLIAELQRDSEHIRTWWPRHDVCASKRKSSPSLIADHNGGYACGLPRRLDHAP